MVHFSIRFFLAYCWGTLFLGAAPGVDLDGNSASEIWELRYPGLISKAGDADGDSVSDWDEMIAGTDPTDSSERLRFNQLLQNEGLAELSWNAKPGKIYRVEKLNVESDRWEEISTFTPSLVPLVRQVEVLLEEGGQIYRLAVSDGDGDGDGVSGWEEWLLGWDDSNPRSGDASMNDYERAVRILEGSTGATLVSGEVLPQRLPDAAEAARFLVQTTFGPTTESIQEVMQLGMGGWMDQQMGMSATTTRSQLSRTGVAYSASWWRHGWWRAVLVSPDQLRHRMAYSLSQIFVVNNEVGTVIGDNPYTKAVYYDFLVNGAFGDFRDVLEEVTYSPTMGFYLSHLNNRKSDPATNRFPDENFAREVMQLFTIGLWKLNPDGSHKLDAEDNSIPTYDNSVITEMAKVFTGMSHSKTMGGRTATSFYDSARGNDYQFPMKVWDEEHEPGPKTLFNNVTIPTGQSGEEDVQQALNALADHESTAPFISRLLIQRFTSSNPSPDYLRRVSLAWQAGDGDLEEVLRAIFFDPEARTVDLGEGIRGKIREPLLRMTHIMRAFALPDESGKFGVLAGQVKADLGQFVMSSPSVFNFYLPDHTPTGFFSERGLVAPEFQIATSSTLLTTHDLLKFTAVIGHWVRGIDFSDEVGMLDDVDALVTHLDTLLTFGTMSEATKAAVIDQINGEWSEFNKVAIAAQMIVTSPDFSVLK